MNEKIYVLANKLKKLDAEKLSMIEQATNNCLAVQTLEKLKISKSKELNK